MTETISQTDKHDPEPPLAIPRPETDAEALRAIDNAVSHIHERALQIRAAPEEHKPKLVLSQHVRGTSIDCVQKHRQREGWRIYVKAFRWHVSLGRWRYLLAFPFISLAAALRPSPKPPNLPTKPPL